MQKWGEAQSCLGKRAEMKGHGHAQQHKVAPLNFWKDFWAATRWHKQSMSDFCVGMVDDFDFFMEFLGCVFAERCVCVILYLFCGLKEGFCGEVKCRFLGFYLGQKGMKG